ncbi:MAG: ABC transporter substrate-binding protein [Propionibacteriaceae bacterium]|nr:ABC transporter substrate-binding protein [Propionibacteriaceae bacterium]
MRISKIPAAVAAVALSITLAACGGGGTTSTPASGGSSADASKAATATSAADLGGMDALVEAAKKEGKLNVIALPDDWANYGELKKNFEKKYGIKVNSILPDASSKEEIDAADKNKGTDKAPDVFDLGSAVTLASTDRFAPYKVEAWDEIPGANKEATGLWVNDYTGIMSVGYNVTKFGEIKSLDELTDSKFAGQVALNGKPTEAGAAFNGYLMVNNANGGSFDNMQPGIDYIKKLKGAGTLNVQDVTASTIDAGTHGVVFDWTYNQVSTTERLKSKGVDWKVFVPAKGEIASYYNQAINKDAPNPAAARLWQEYLYSAEGQNGWLKGGATPILFESMEKAGTLDKAAADALPKVENTPQTPSTEQVEAANAFLKQNWDSAVA